MKKSRFTEEQIAFALRQAEGGTSVRDVCRKMGVSEQTFYLWKKKFAGMPIKPSTVYVSLALVDCRSWVVWSGAEGGPVAIVFGTGGLGAQGGPGGHGGDGAAVTLSYSGTLSNPDGNAHFYTCGGEGVEAHRACSACLLAWVPYKAILEQPPQPRDRSP